MSKRPSEMTNEELEALPNLRKRTRRLATLQEQKRRGVLWIEEEIEPPKMKANAILGDDLFGWQDGDGNCWSFSEGADGQWYKVYMPADVFKIAVKLFRAANCASKVTP